jgi:hypothetical protein
MTAILPDYTSIRELSQNISEDGIDLKAAQEALDRDDWVQLDDVKKELNNA